MESKPSSFTPEEVATPRKSWEEPAILMERSLVAEAQEEDVMMEDPFLGPLGLSA